MPGLFNNSMCKRNKNGKSLCAQIPISIFYSALKNAWVLVAGQLWQTEVMMKNGKEVYCRAWELLWFHCYQRHYFFDNKELHWFKILWRKRLGLKHFWRQRHISWAWNVTTYKHWISVHIVISALRPLLKQNHRCSFSQYFKWHSHQSYECNKLPCMV